MFWMRADSLCWQVGEGWALDRDFLGAYYVLYSFLLISNKFCYGGSGPSRKFLYATERPDMAIKFFYAPAPPPPIVWALKPPAWALVHITAYAL